jgi:hypothetical protein
MRVAVSRYKIWGLVLSVWFCGTLSGQEKRSIHIQADYDLSYYIQYNGVSYNSTRTGYLEIPALAPGAHTLVMGFTGAITPEYAFQCTVTDNPISFALRIAVDNSWSLFDMVDFTVTRGAPATKAELRMAARVPADLRPGIRKIFDKATPGGVDRVYIVTNGTQMDTVALFIPVPDQERPKETGKLGSEPFPADRGAAHTPAAAVLTRNPGIS